MTFRCVKMNNPLTLLDARGLMLKAFHGANLAEYWQKEARAARETRGVQA